MNNDIIPKKTHDLTRLNIGCARFETDFHNIHDECRFLTIFATDIRYPNKYEITETEVNRAIAAVEKIRCFKPMLDMKTVVNNE